MGILDKRGLWPILAAQQLAACAFGCLDVDMSDRLTVSELSKQIQRIVQDETLHDPSGVAEIMYPDGSTCSGEVLNLQPHRSQAGHAYSGGWVCGVKSGRGRQTLPSGKCFDGDFAKGKLVSMVQRLT